MIFYCKRNKFYKKYSYGRNNKGIITIRGRSSKFFKYNQFKNSNFNYIFKNNLSNIPCIYAKIVGIITNLIKNTFLFKIEFIQQKFKYLNYKFLPITKGVSIGDIISLGKDSTLNKGNILPLFKIPVGEYVHNIESYLGKGSTYVKSSKHSALIITQGLKYVTLKLPSGEIRLLNKNVFCIYGELINNSRFNQKFNAGFSRKLGKRPKVRGVAMNACDHPHGGGEGKNPIGKKAPYTPWGKMFHGIHTRKNNKYSNKYIIVNKND